jgi:RsiW-degrading membrane proteinase PrsW (M82 family)
VPPVNDRPNKLALVAAYLLPVWLIVMVVGLYAAAFGWRPGAYLMITALLGDIVSHTLMGVTEYRRVMRRPWPKVPPIDADDEW